MTNATATHHPVTSTPSRAGRSWLRGLGLLLLSGILMTLSFPSWGPHGSGLWFLAPLCLAPFGLCIIRRPASFLWLATYYLFAGLWFSLNCYWLWAITFPGTLALSFYVALYWLLFAFCTRRLIVHLRWPALLALPLAWVITEYLRATIFSGFAWFTLGNALAGAPLLIQTADLGGVWLLSFLTAMTSGLLVDLYRLPLRKPSPLLRTLILIYLLTISAALIYGFFRLHQDITPAELQNTQATSPKGPKVAVIQEYIPQSQKDDPDPNTQLDFFNRHVQLSLAASTLQPDLIVWPETMVPNAINPEFLALVAKSEEGNQILNQARGFDASLKALAAQTHSYLLVGAPYREFITADFIKKQNASFLYQPGHQLSPSAPSPQDQPPTQYPFYYAKRYLVPFGEYIPFRETFPWLNGLLLKLTPYGYDYSITPGAAWQRFTLHTRDPKPYVYTFGTPICYEDVMPYPSRNFVAPINQRKQVDFLVSISNDGWYVSVDELEQHRQMDQIRAVENRVPIARAVNGGASGFINSNGYITGEVQQNGKTHFVPGFAVQTLAVDRRISLYSQIGDLFPLLCGLLTSLAVAWTLVRPRLGRSKTEPSCSTDIQDDN